MFELHTIERVCARVPGGLKNLKLVDPLDLATPATWNVAQTLDGLDFLPGKSAYSLGKDLLSGRLEGETNTSTPAGDYFTYRLTATVRAIRPTVESLRAKLINRRIHVVAEYRDGLQRLVPYMRLSAKDDSGSTWNAYQGYTFTGVGSLLMPGPGLGGNIETAPAPDPEEPGAGGGSVTLVELTATDTTYSYVVPSGKWVDGIEIRSTSAQTIKIGTTAGGEEISGMPVPLDALQPYVANGALFDTFSSKTIYFSDLAGTNSIRIWLLG